MHDLDPRGRGRAPGSAPRRGRRSPRRTSWRRCSSRGGPRDRSRPGRRVKYESMGIGVDERGPAPDEQVVLAPTDHRAQLGVVVGLDLGVDADLGQGPADQLVGGLGVLGFGADRPAERQLLATTGHLADTVAVGVLVAGLVEDPIGLVEVEGEGLLGSRGSTRGRGTATSRPPARRGRSGPGRRWSPCRRRGRWPVGPGRPPTPGDRLRCPRRRRSWPARRTRPAGPGRPRCRGSPPGAPRSRRGCCGRHRSRPARAPPPSRRGW